MILEALLKLPWTFAGTTDTVRNHIWRDLMKDYKGGWYEGGKENCKTGKIFFGALVVTVPDHPITPDEVESCIDFPYCNFCEMGNDYKNIKSMEDLLKIWERTTPKYAPTPPRPATS